MVFLTCHDFDLDTRTLFKVCIREGKWPWTESCREISRLINLFAPKSGVIAKHYWLHLYISCPTAQALITKLEMKTLIEMLLFI